MLNELIDQAKKIEAAQAADGTKFAGAAVQVTKKLSVDECEEIFIEQNAEPRMMKNIQRVRDGVKGFSVYQLQNAVQQIIVQSQIVR